MESDNLTFELILRINSSFSIVRQLIDKAIHGVQLLAETFIIESGQKSPTLEGPTLKKN